MLTFVREPAVMSELARYIAQSPRLIRLGLDLDEHLPWYRGPSR